MSVFSLKIYARARAVKVCIPMMGVKAIKVPTAIARAISLGERPFLLKRIIRFFSFEKYFKRLCPDRSNYSLTIRAASKPYLESVRKVVF